MNFLQTFIIYIVDFYAHIIFILNRFKIKFFPHNDIFFQISNVFCISNNINTTNQFISNKLDVRSDDIYCFEWIFDNVKYKQYLNKETLKYLVPYSIYTLRNKLPDCKIIGCLLTKNKTNEIDNVTNFIKEIAGPFQNFHKGIYQIYTKDIFGYQNTNLQIRTTKSVYNFDLSKDNLLEL